MAQTQDHKVSFAMPISKVVAIVTGGCSGLGIAFSEALAEVGANIVVADVLLGTA